MSPAFQGTDSVLYLKNVKDRFSRVLPPVFQGANLCKPSFIPMKKILRISWLAWRNGALPTLCKDVLLAGFILVGILLTDSSFGFLIRLAVEVALD